MEKICGKCGHLLSEFVLDSEENATMPTGSTAIRRGIYEADFMDALNQHIENTYKDKYAHGIEPLDFMESHDMDDFLRGNIVKYIMRTKYKKNILDLLKAGHYLARLYSMIKSRDTEDLYSRNAETKK